jgi:transketolase
MKKLLSNEFHQSERGYFAGLLYNEMIDNPNIALITADLGFGMFDKIRDDFPDRFFNVGASELSAVCISCGMALEGKTVFFYSITPFALWRPAEAIRIYVNHEQIPIKIIGGGRDKDYEYDGFTHDGSDIKDLLKCFSNIVSYFPNDKEDIEKILKTTIINKMPTFISLSR